MALAMPSFRLPKVSTFNLLLLNKFLLIVIMILMSFIKDIETTNVNGNVIMNETRSENEINLKRVLRTHSLPSERSYRLPNTTFPLHYHLHIVSNIHLQDFNYKGNITIDILVKESTNEIVLHSTNLTIQAIKVSNLKTGDMFDDLTYSLDVLHSFLIIHPIDDYLRFESGQLLRIEILYKNVMNEKTFGLYWLTYENNNNQTVYLAATQCEPTSARLAFPCYDEPAFKANFSIRLTHGRHYNSISNMDVKHIHHHHHHYHEHEHEHEEQQHHKQCPYENSLNDEQTNSINDNCLMTTTTFYTTPAMSTYLIAFVISDFEYIEEMYRGIRHRIYTPPSNHEKGYRPLKNSILTITALEDYFGISYPLNKLDHIALKKNFGAAMENWGLITHNEHNLLSNNDAGMHKVLIDTFTLTHELSHQWFGNLVSPEWWSYVWLSEGFASYFGYIITELIHPELKPMDFFHMDVRMRAFSFNNMYERPMTYYVEKESEIISMFDSISYEKAPCVIRMFHHAFNQKTFVKGISKFFTKFQYSVGNELQLFDAIQEAVDEDTQLNTQKWKHLVREILLSWTHSEWVPIVTVIRNYDDNTITLKQRSKSKRNDEHWWIPLNFATNRKPDFEQTTAEYFMPPLSEITLTPAELGITLEHDDWLIVNKQGIGFYHVLYDDYNLLAIAKALQHDHEQIHALNRAFIFTDLCSLIESNKIVSIDVVLELLKYLKYEKDYIAWYSVSDTIQFFLDNLYSTDAYEPFQQFIRTLVQPIYNDLFGAMDPTQFLMNLNNMSTIELAARNFILQIACKSNLSDCSQYTHTLAMEFINRRVPKLGPKKDYYLIHETILCQGIKNLNDDDFNLLLNMLTKPKEDSMWYIDLVFSLRCTEKISHLEQYLNAIFSTENIMNDPDSMMDLSYLYTSNTIARPVMLKFFKQKYRMLCQSPYFIENLNRIAEFLAPEYKQHFIELHNLLSAEMNLSKCRENRDELLPLTSPLIGKNSKIPEEFVKQHSKMIYEWLIKEQSSQTYMAASMDARSTANRNGLRFLREPGKLFRQLIQLTF